MERIAEWNAFLKRHYQRILLAQTATKQTSTDKLGATPLPFYCSQYFYVAREAYS